MFNLAPAKHAKVQKELKVMNHDMIMKLTVYCIGVTGLSFLIIL